MTVLPDASIELATLHEGEEYLVPLQREGEETPITGFLMVLAGTKRFRYMKVSDQRLRSYPGGELVIRGEDAHGPSQD